MGNVAAVCLCPDVRARVDVPFGPEDTEVAENAEGVRNPGPFDFLIMNLLRVLRALSVLRVSPDHAAGRPVDCHTPAETRSLVVTP
jgi:hypothetical protein